jgi:glycerophosphoryl diester phosphodiesterase
VDDAATMEDLLKLGVDGIMTDRPRRLRDVMQRRGVWMPPHNHEDPHAAG